MTRVLDRRRLLAATAALGLGACASLDGDDVAGAQDSAATPLSTADLAWLNRITWGTNASTAARLSRQGRARFLARQLDDRAAGALPPPVQAQFDALRISRQPMDALVLELEQQRRAADAAGSDEQKSAARQAHQQALTHVAREAGTRMLLRAVYSPAQLREQMTWFWFNHFNVHQGKHNLRAMVGSYEDALRAHALGRFRDLLGASALHPAMIRYLDNDQNAANRVNENYARELLELHTLGVDGGYTQTDVQELARVLTGLGVNLTGQPPNVRPQLQALVVARGLMLFNPQRHDMGDKRVLGAVVKGRGFDEIGEVLDRLAAHPSTARFVCGKIAAHFVADSPPPALVERMVQRFLQSDGRIAEVLRTMFEAPEFEASLAPGHGKFKDPTRYVVSAVRLAYDTTVVVNAQPLLGWLSRMGQAPYNRQTPDGYPGGEAAWASPGQMAVRFDIARQIGNGNAGLFRAEGALPDPAQQRQAQALALPQLSSGPLVAHTWQAALSATTRAALDTAASTAEWNAYFLSAPEFMLR